VNIFKDQLKLADGIITTTDYLKSVYKQYHKEVHVVKNSIDFGVWDKLKKPKKNGKKIRIGWEGSMHHHADLEIIAEAIPKVIKKHKNAEFHFFGYLPTQLQNCCKHHNFVSIGNYPQSMAKANMDIMLGPLEDTAFNRGVSNIRVLEAGALKKAVVVSENKNLPYAKMINGGDDGDGLLAKTTDDWIYCINWLIENPDERKAMGKRLYRKVKDNYNIKDEAKVYEKVLKSFI
jgi:glycosyltransferase involved in cell wall biosynthesis